MCADQKRRVLRTHRRHTQVNILDRKGREPLGRETDLIARSRRYVGEAIRTDQIGSLREPHARRLIGQRDHGARHNSTGLV